MVPESDEKLCLYKCKGLIAATRDKSGCARGVPRVDLDIFAGPLDLLLYLVKKHEVDITEVPIAKVTEEFVAYLEVRRSWQ